MEKKITQLSKFPTEALVMNYRRHRVCRTRFPMSYHRSYNNNTCKWEYWIPIFGPLEIDGVVYNPCEIFYKKLTPNELKEDFTEIKGDLWEVSNDGWFSFTDEIEFTFEGMYWRGKISEIKDEMAKRPHVPLKGKKAFRRWKQTYKKNNKKRR